MALGRKVSVCLSTRTGSLPTDRQYTGQRHELGLGFYDYNARYYAPALGRFVSADTLVPEPGNPQALNRYVYVYNNPLRYTDPTGYFSEEQLNWLGYTKDNTPDDMWAFLLTLQPGDFIGGAEQNNVRSLVIGQRSYDDEKASYGLWLERGDEKAELLQWLSNQSDLGKVWAYRFGSEMNARTWQASCPIRGTFYGQSAQTVENLNSMVVTTEMQASLRRFLGGVWDAALSSVPTGKHKALKHTDVPPGHLRGDVRMQFMYFDSLNVTMTTRTVWLRPNTRFGSMQIVSDERVSFSPSSP